MEQFNNVYLIGEDILDPYGGAFKVATGLSTRFPSQVISTPISESAIVGFATGLALKGLIPIVEIMFGDFISLSFDQILNHLTKFNLMYNKKVNPHVIIRTPMGGYRGYGPTHSQSLEKFLTGIPNLKVFYPTIHHDIGNIFKEIVLKEKGPIVFIENKSDYAKYNILPKENKLGFYQINASSEKYPTFTYSLNNFDNVDVTIFCFGGLVEPILKEAIDILKENEIYCEIITPVQINPMDIAPVVHSLKKSGRLVTVEEGTPVNGIGSEIISRIAEYNSGLFKSNPIKISAKEGIVPSSRELEKQWLPSMSDLRFSIEALIRNDGYQ